VAGVVVVAVGAGLVAADRFTRASLCSSQMVGRAMTRYVWKLPPMSSSGQIILLSDRAYGTQARAEPVLPADFGLGLPGRVLPALLPPVLTELAVVESAKHVRVVVQSVGGVLHLVKVMAVIACGCFLLRSLTYDVQLFAA
jgi:hypothetical protein